MPFHRPRTLWLRLAWPFLLYVIAGSVGLAFWMHRAALVRSHAVFAALAHANADFFRDRRLPASVQMAGDFSRMLNVETIIRRGSELLPEPSGAAAQHRAELLALRGDRGVVRLGADFEAIAAPMDTERSLLLIRPAEPAWAFLREGETVAVLLIFWALSFGLAWALTRGVVHPLRLLAARLPHIGHDSSESLPGADRDDEIGQLARAYLATRTQLAAERTLREQSERLALLGRVATGLAHEIHNPLSAMRMHAQLIDSAPAGEVEQAVHASLPVLLDETAKIESLVNQWMFLARPAPPETAPTDLAMLVSQVVRTYAALAEHADVKIEWNTASALVARADSRRLGQAISNVIVNAIQAMPDGGILCITGEIAGDRIQLTFQDGGRGFSPEALARHAELFFSEKEGGMGIGLNITAKILKAHRGECVVANAPAGGALVTFYLPRA